MTASAEPHLFFSNADRPFEMSKKHLGALSLLDKVPFTRRAVAPDESIPHLGVGFACGVCVVPNPMNFVDI